MKSSNTILNKEPKGDIPYFSIFLPALSVSTNQLRKGPPQSTVPKPPPPARPAAPRAPRFCSGGRLCAQRCYVQFPLHGWLAVGDCSDNQPTETPHNIPLGAPPASQRGRAGRRGGQGATRVASTTSPSFQLDSVSGEPIRQSPESC